MSEQKKKKINKLDRTQFFKLCTYIQGDQARFLAEKPRLSKAAQEASRVLDFVVTISHIISAQEATGIMWRYEPKQKGSGAASQHYRDERMRIVTDAITHLYEACGEKLPDEFKEMLARRHNPIPVPERTPTNGKVDVSVVNKM